jgi:hypothetical protein
MSGFHGVALLFLVLAVKTSVGQKGRSENNWALLLIAFNAQADFL